eukprot:tig00001030_g6465.t1
MAAEARPDAPVARPTWLPIALVGCIGSGKRSLLPALKFSCGQLVKERPETVLCDGEPVSYTTASFEIGHNYKIEPSVWANYLIDCYCFIFVVDSSDEANLQKNRRLLLKLVREPRTQAKPFVIFCSKQDVPGALTPEEIEQRLGVSQMREGLVYRVMGTEAVARASDAPSNKNYRPDPRIGEGLVWLIETVRGNYRFLKKKAGRDKAAQVVIDELLREAKEGPARRYAALRKAAAAEAARLEALVARTAEFDLQGALQDVATSAALARELPKRAKAAERKTKEAFEAEIGALVEEERSDAAARELLEARAGGKAGEEAEAEKERLARRLTAAEEELALEREAGGKLREGAARERAELQSRVDALRSALAAFADAAQRDEPAPRPASRGDGEGAPAAAASGAGAGEEEGPTVEGLMASSPWEVPALQRLLAGAEEELRGVLAIKRALRKDLLAWSARFSEGGPEGRGEGGGGPEEGALSELQALFARVHALDAKEGQLRTHAQVYALKIDQLRSGVVPPAAPAPADRPAPATSEAESYEVRRLRVLTEEAARAQAELQAKVAALSARLADQDEVLRMTKKELAAKRDELSALEGALSRTTAELEGKARQLAESRARAAPPPAPRAAPAAPKAPAPAPAGAWKAGEGEGAVREAEEARLTAASVRNMERWVQVVAVSRLKRSQVERQLAEAEAAKAELERRLVDVELEVRKEEGRRLAALREEYEALLGTMRRQQQRLEADVAEERQRVAARMQELLAAAKRAAEDRVALAERIERGFRALKAVRDERASSALGERTLARLGAAPADPAGGPWILPAYEAAVHFARHVPPRLAASLADTAAQWMLHHGLLSSGATAAASLGAGTGPGRDVPGPWGHAMHAAVSVLPQPFPQAGYAAARGVAPDLALLLWRASRDFDFVTSQLEGYAMVDSFVAGLLGVYRAAYADEAPRQPVALALHRFDFLVDTSRAQGPAVKCVKHASTYGTPLALSGLATLMHQHVIQRTGVEAYAGVVMPPNPLLVNVPAAVARAARLYEEQRGLVPPAARARAAGEEAPAKQHWTPQTAVLMVVPGGPHDEVDERWLEFLLWEQYRLPCVRRSLQALAAAPEELRVEPAGGELRVAGRHVAVVLFRGGHHPDDYPTQREWEVRTALECSAAVKGPPVGLQLLGSRWMHYVLLNQPGVLERFVADPTRAKRLRKAVLGRWSLQAGHENGAQVARAVKHPSKFALTTYYEEEDGSQQLGRQMATTLQNAPPEELATYLLVERLQSPAARSLVLRAGAYANLDALFALSLFSAFLVDESRVLVNEPVGHCMQTHIDGLDKLRYPPYEYLASPFFSS